MQNPISLLQYRALRAFACCGRSSEYQLQRTWWCRFRCIRTIACADGNNNCCEYTQDTHCGMTACLGTDNAVTATDCAVNKARTMLDTKMYLSYVCFHPETATNQSTNSSSKR